VEWNAWHDEGEEVMDTIVLNLTEDSRLKVKKTVPFSDGYANYRITMEMMDDDGNWTDGKETVVEDGTSFNVPANEILLTQDDFIPFLTEMEKLKKLMVLE
jgi:hypothetical protein